MIGVGGGRWLFRIGESGWELVCLCVEAVGSRMRELILKCNEGFRCCSIYLVVDNYLFIIIMNL